MFRGFGLFNINLLCFMSFLFQKAENNRSKKFRNIIFLFLLKIGLVGPVDQQINLVSPKYEI